MHPARVESSALWAAYGDALGFITERRGVAGGHSKGVPEVVSQPIAWKRRIGGRFGPTLELPAGCYSDDTQLRLATSRSIRGDGTFDVEAFARVELPVWLAYQLGAGKGTSAAARHLERKDVTWYSNFFDEGGASYLKSGGNGAAMRIQPHVWALRHGRNAIEILTLDVLRNAVTTHGHPRGFLGALFHALCLHHVLTEAEVPGPKVWLAIVAQFKTAIKVIVADEHLDRVWRSSWEASAGETLEDAIRKVQAECSADIATAVECVGNLPPAGAYSEVLHRVGGMEPATVGSGTKTAILAALVSYAFRDQDAGAALVAAANERGSDTDTIATMAGAISGAMDLSRPAVSPLDVDYLVEEGARLARIANGQPARTFAYPDLLLWRAPKTQSDVVGLFQGSLSIAGLGKATALSKPIRGSNRDDWAWEWVRMDFGQSLLVKRRLKLGQLVPDALPRELESRSDGGRLEGSDSRVTGASPGGETSVSYSFIPSEPTLFDQAPLAEVKRSQKRRPLDELTGEVIRSGFDPSTVGRNFLAAMDHSSNPIEWAIAYAAIVAKARVARQRGRQGVEAADPNPREAGS